MLENDLKLRVKRLIAGDYRTTDLDRLFLGLRNLLLIVISATKVLQLNLAGIFSLVLIFGV